MSKIPVDWHITPARLKADSHAVSWKSSGRMGPENSTPHILLWSLSSLSLFQKANCFCWTCAYSPEITVTCRSQTAALLNRHSVCSNQHLDWTHGPKLSCRCWVFLMGHPSLVHPVWHRTFGYTAVFILDNLHKKYHLWLQLTGVE